MVDGWGMWKSRAGRESKAPQMRKLNQCALPRQLRPRWGLRLIYSPKPRNQAIKRNQTIRFPALNGPTVWFGESEVGLNPLEVAGEQQSPRLRNSRPRVGTDRGTRGDRVRMMAQSTPCLPEVWSSSRQPRLTAVNHGIKGHRLTAGVKPCLLFSNLSKCQSSLSRNSHWIIQH